MKRSLVFGLCCLAASAALWSPAFAEPTAAPKIELRDLEVGSDGSVIGTIVNDGGTVISKIELLVTHAWSWSDERHPGEDNPARASVVRVAGEIPAKGSLPFSYTPSPPLPKRTDGSFETTVAVHSFAETGP